MLLLPHFSIEGIVCTEQGEHQRITLTSPLPLFDRKQSQNQIPDCTPLGRAPMSISLFNGILKKM